MYSIRVLVILLFSITTSFSLATYERTLTFKISHSYPTNLGIELHKVCAQEKNHNANQCKLSHSENIRYLLPSRDTHKFSLSNYPTDKLNAFTFTVYNKISDNKEMYLCGVSALDIMAGVVPIIDNRKAVCDIIYNGSMNKNGNDWLIEVNISHKL